MRKIAIVFLVFLSLSCFSQTKENFLNSIYKVKVDSSFSKYYLYSDCLSINLNKYDSLKVVNDFSGFAPVVIINEIIAKSKIDTGSLVWECEKLEKAACIKSSAGILMNENSITINPNWNNSKKKREVNKQFAHQKQNFDRKPKQEKIIYSFSRPIFDEKGEYAIIEMWSYCGNTCGQGCIVLFKRKDNVWKMIADTSCKFS